MRSFLIGLLIAGAAGCGPTDPGTGEPPVEPEVWQNVAPELILASPGKMAVGEDLVLLGEDFIEAAKGSLILRLRGKYTDDQGTVYPVDLQLEPTRVNGSKLRWRLWPNIVFHPNGNQLGYFLGEVSVVNVGHDGSQKASNAYPTKIEIKPSLIPMFAQPRSSGCQPVVAETLGRAPFTFAVEAVGLRQGTPEEPLTFRWNFMAEQWEIEFYQQFNGLFEDPADANKVPSGSIQLEERVTSGRMSVISDSAEASFMVKVKEFFVGSGGVKSLKTRDVSIGNDYLASVAIAVIDGSGKTASVVIPISIFKAAVLHYDGNQQLAERLPPELVSDCLPGGLYGTNVNYREDSSRTVSRSYRLNFTGNAGINMGLPSDPFALNATLSAGFGVDVDSTISSTQSKSTDISAQVLPGEFAASYRQVSKYYRVGKLVSRNICGQKLEVADVTLTDYVFAFDLARGLTCPPASNLPPAQKVLD
jgi:hypothetical protein